MAATSSPRRRRVRLSSMETLGFFDTPTTTSDRPAQRTTPAAVTTRTTAAPSTDVITDLWESTDAESPTLVDSKPQATGRHLQRRNFRWTVALLVTGLILGTLAAGYWIYQRPITAGIVAASQVTEDAHELATALDMLAPHAEELASGALDDEASFSAATLAVNQSARSMFSASADLPGTESVTRSIAADTASAALDASRTLTDTYAYLTALGPALIPPALETDASLVDLGVAVDDFVSWRARMNSVAEALPTGVASGVSAELTMFIASLDTAQSAYLDALGSEDARFGAVAVLDAITLELGALRADLLEAMQDEAATAAAQIAEAREDLDRLVG